MGEEPERHGPGAKENEIPSVNAVDGRSLPDGALSVTIFRTPCEECGMMLSASLRLHKCLARSPAGRSERTRGC
eukprot:gene23170-22636_t